MQTSAMIKMIGRFYREHRKRVQEIMGAEGLYFGQHPILWELLNGGEQTQVELAQKLGVTVVTVSNSVRRLSERGFVERNLDPKDRRKNCIAITESGKQAALRCQEEFRKLEKEIFKNVSEDEMQETYQLFQRMIENMK